MSVSREPFEASRRDGFAPPAAETETALGARASVLAEGVEARNELPGRALRAPIGIKPRADLGERRNIGEGH
jgi:hypothetical protein